MPLHSRHFSHFSKLTLFIALFIVVSASFMRQAMDFAKGFLGQGVFAVLLALIFIIPASILLIFILRNRVSPVRAAGFSAVLGVGVFLSWQMKIPVEKAHILEYGVLGWLAARDLVFSKKLKGIISACLFVALAGTLDEVFQYFLPYRVYDLRDIGFNVLGGIWGIALYLIQHPTSLKAKKNSAPNPTFREFKSL